LGDRLEAFVPLTPIRDPVPADIEPLATIWYDGWRDAHGAILPELLRRHRTRDSFRDRLAAATADLRVAGPPGDPLGFFMLKGDELYQLYVSAGARGTGIARALTADAERELAERGIELAWLHCAIGNDRAARFYEKSGWRRAGVVQSELATPEGPVVIEVWRFEKAVHRPVLRPLHPPP